MVKEGDGSPLVSQTTRQDEGVYRQVAVGCGRHLKIVIIIKKLKKPDQSARMLKGWKALMKN